MPADADCYQLKDICTDKAIDICPASQNKRDFNDRGIAEDNSPSQRQPAPPLTSAKQVEHQKLRAKLNALFGCFEVVFGGDR